MSQTYGSKMDNLEPIGRRGEPIRVGDIVYIYPEGKHFPTPEKLIITADIGNGRYEVQYPGEKAIYTERHDHLYRKSKE